MIDLLFWFLAGVGTLTVLYFVFLLWKMIDDYRNRN